MKGKRIFVKIYGTENNEVIMKEIGNGLRHMEIKTERLILCPLGMKYLDSTFEYSSDLENTRYMMFLPNETLNEAAEFLKNVESEWASETPKFYEFAILLNEVHIGAVGLYLDESRRTGEFGWILNKRYWNQGYITEAAAAVLDFGINKLGLKRLIAHCDSENVGSFKVMEKLGMCFVSCSGGRKNKASGEERKEYLYELAL